MEETDVQLQLKKRARRRLVGATAFVALVAVALPMIMDHEPRPVVQEVEIRIPGQDEKPFSPKFSPVSAEKPAPPKAAVDAGDKAPENTPAQKPAGALPAPKAAEKTTEKPATKPANKLVERPPEKLPPAKPAEKKPEKTLEKTPEKPRDKPLEKAADAEARRAAAILAGKSAEPIARTVEKPAVSSAPAGGEFVILIGAFANEANVKQLRGKLGEQGVKSYTEPLDSPQGRKTRVRAGPFANREAADKALEKMKRIGVSGVVAAR